MSSELSAFGKANVNAFERETSEPDDVLERFSAVGRARMYLSRAVIGSIEGRTMPVHSRLDRAVELLDGHVSEDLCQRLSGARVRHERGETAEARREVRECMQLLDVELRPEVGDGE